jgi:hypothetical protein
MSRKAMVEFVILPVVLAAGAIFDRIKANIGAMAAMRWMLSACDELGGVSPLQAIKAGCADDVWRVTECLQDSRGTLKLVRPTLYNSAGRISDGSSIRAEKAAIK